LAFLVAKLAMKHNLCIIVLRSKRKDTRDDRLLANNQHTVLRCHNRARPEAADYAFSPKRRFMRSEKNGLQARDPLFLRQF
jgi:hypothetical protein